MAGFTLDARHTSLLGAIVAATEETSPDPCRGRCLSRSKTCSTPTRARGWGSTPCCRTSSSRRVSIPKVRASTPRRRRRRWTTRSRGPTGNCRAATPTAPATTHRRRRARTSRARARSETARVSAVRPRHVRGRAHRAGGLPSLAARCPCRCGGLGTGPPRRPPCDSAARRSGSFGCGRVGGCDRAGSLATLAIVGGIHARAKGSANGCQCLLQRIVTGVNRYLHALLLGRSGDVISRCWTPR